VFIAHMVYIVSIAPMWRIAHIAHIRRRIVQWR
jgi:hypothetical protein